MATAIQFPAVLFAGNASVEEVVEPASLPTCWMSLIAGVPDCTAKRTPLLAMPPTVTTTLPVVAPVGTGTTMLVVLQLVGVAVVPLKVTVLVPCEVPKLAPVIVTDVPMGPDVGFSEAMLGTVPPPLPAARKAAICMIQSWTVLSTAVAL